jgi:hypothetical protein
LPVQIPDTSLPFGGRKLEMWLAKSMDDEPGTQLLEPVIVEGIMVDKRPSSRNGGAVHQPRI